MAEVRPFRGLRYNREIVGDIGRVLTPPFDVISAADQAGFYAQNEYNVVRLEQGQEFPGDSAEENKYTRSAAFLKQWLATGVLHQEESAAFYVYDQGFSLIDGEAKRRRGLIAAVRLEDWERRVVLPHEETMAGPKIDRLALMRACRANFSPVFGLYEDTGATSALLARGAAAEPVVDTVTPDGEQHVLWAVREPGLVREISEAFAPFSILIADGHHRYETALAYRNERRQQEPEAPADAAFNYVMMVLVSMTDPGLVVLPTHRLVKAVPVGTEGLIERLRAFFNVKALPIPAEAQPALEEALAEMARRGRQAPTFGVAGLAANTLHLLTLREKAAVAELMPREHCQAWKDLDVSILQVAILQHLLGLPEAKGREDLAYTRDAAEAWESVQKGEYCLAFFLNSTGVAEMRDVAEANDRMPPKSTYFQPKLPTGLVISLLDR